jgi:hypothetical protein
MGKVHRIKKRFWKLVSQDPLPYGRHSLGDVSITIGKTLSGKDYVSYYSYYHHYNGLLTQLIEEYKSQG